MVDPAVSVSVLEGVKVMDVVVLVEVSGGGGDG